MENKSLKYLPSKYENAYKEMLINESKKYGVKVARITTFGHNEDSPEMELKMDIVLKGEEKDIEKFESYVNETEINELVFCDVTEEGHVYILFTNWDIEDSEGINSMVNKMNDFVDKCEKGYNVKIEGEDNETFFSKEIEWGMFENIEF